MGITSQASKRLALKLMAGIVSRKYEPALCKIAAQSSFTPQLLNLSTPEASQLKKLISDVRTQYAIDFAAPAAASAPAPELQLSGGGMDPVALQLDEADMTAETYTQELELFESSVKAHEKRLLDNYLAVNAAIIVDDGTDLEKRKRKLLALPVASEKKRKLFVKDFMVAQGIFVFCFCFLKQNVIIIIIFRFGLRAPEQVAQVHV